MRLEQGELGHCFTPRVTRPVKVQRFRAQLQCRHRASHIRHVGQSGSQSDTRNSSAAQEVCRKSTSRVRRRCKHECTTSRAKEKKKKKKRKARHWCAASLPRQIERADKFTLRVQQIGPRRSRRWSRLEA